MNLKFRLTVFVLFVFLSVVSGQKMVKGRVIDLQTREPIELVTISLPDGSVKTCTDARGDFRIAFPGDSGSLYISIIGYKPVIIQSYSNEKLIVELSKGAVDLKEVTIYPQSNNTGFHTISGIDLRLRPVNSSQDLLRLVPGLFLGQHQGGGIAEHIFFRGFDADHGTDVNVSVDGMPLNLVSHAHGQGFADLHYLIPELVKTYDFGKGPYYSAYGDFTTAGYVAFQTADVLEKNEIKLEGGQFHTGRIMGQFNLLNEKARKKGICAYLAAEAAYTDGAFDWAQHFNRVNIFGKFIVPLNARSRLTATISTFNSDWRSSGEIPERAVDEGLIGRFGYIDSTQGGNTNRTNGILKLVTQMGDRMQLENQLYYSKYYFHLHYNTSFYAGDSVNGDQLRQRESRNLYGYNGKLSRQDYYTNGSVLSSVFGLGWQYNAIAPSELSHTINRNQVLDYIQLGEVREMAINGFVDESWQSGKWNFNAGARLDYLYFDYSDLLNPKQPARGKWIASPKINISYSVSNALAIYLKAGKGFHSNDAKVVTANQGYSVLPAAYGADLDFSWKPLPRLYITGGIWWLYLQQEFVYDADEGVLEAGDPSKRVGLDFSMRYQFNDWLFANLDINLARSRYASAPKGDNYIPLAVPFSSAGGLSVKLPGGWNGGLNYRYMADRPANSDHSLTALGYFVTDLAANYTQKKYEIGLEIQNLFNTEWREAQFETESRLKIQSRYP